MKAFMVMVVRWALMSQQAHGTILNTVNTDPDLSTLASLVSVATMSSTIIPPNGNFTEFLSEDPFLRITLFAPTNQAFAALDADLLARLLTPPWKVHAGHLLVSHLVENRYPESLLSDGLVLDTLTPVFVMDGSLSFSRSQEGLLLISGKNFNNSQVLQGDIFSSPPNSVTHKVDQVFMPDILTLTIYAGFVGSPDRILIDQAGLADFFDTEIMTLLLPNSGFAETIPGPLLDTLNITEVLLNHVVLGDPLSRGSELLPGSSIQTAAGCTYMIGTNEDSQLVVGDVTILLGPFPLINGAFIRIGGLLLPPSNAMAPTTCLGPPTLSPHKSSASPTLGPLSTPPTTTLAPPTPRPESPLAMPSSAPSDATTLPTAAPSIPDTIPAPQPESPFAMPSSTAPSNATTLPTSASSIPDTTAPTTSATPAPRPESPFAMSISTAPSDATKLPNAAPSTPDTTAPATSTASAVYTWLSPIFLGLLAFTF